ncbi:MAG: hypothetical protein HC933_17565 [Pleurocapsa sp. SU_196_0]|nr:hypothetical protein [Pleurocapsa sp. SU_196_0]
MTIPATERFKLVSPSTGFSTSVPYDGDAPWSEWIFCGHSVRYSSPNGAEVNPWDGSEVRRSGSRWAADQDTDLSPEQTAAVELAVNEAKLGAFLEANPLERLDFKNIRTGNADLDLAAGWTAPPEFKDFDQAYPWIVVKPVRRMDTLPRGNEPLRPGLSPVVAVMNDGPTGFMRGILVHELGHHIINTRPDLLGDIREAFSKAKPITLYAADDEHEYFGETLTAYTYYRKILREYDPVGYNLVRDILKRLE